MHRTLFMLCSCNGMFGLLDLIFRRLCSPHARETCLTTARHYVRPAPPLQCLPVQMPLSCTNSVRQWLLRMPRMLARPIGRTSSKNRPNFSRSWDATRISAARNNLMTQGRPIPRSLLLEALENRVPILVLLQFVQMSSKNPAQVA